MYAKDISSKYDSYSFGQMYRVVYINKDLSKTAIEDPVIGSRYLLISDSHLGVYKSIKEATEIYYNELLKIIERESPTHIIHLGDLIDGHTNDDNGVAGIIHALNMFEKLKIPVHVIFGNHDRGYFKISQCKSRGNVHVYSSLALTLKIPETQLHPAQTIYFAHDLKNNYKVLPGMRVSFSEWLKLGFQIAPNDWLILGHMHECFQSCEFRSACVGQFSPEKSVFMYSILDVRDQITFSTHTFL